jgi:hypothetical protein
MEIRDIGLWTKDQIWFTQCLRIAGVTGVKKELIDEVRRKTNFRGQAEYILWQPTKLAESINRDRISLWRAKDYLVTRQILKEDIRKVKKLTGNIIRKHIAINWWVLEWQVSKDEKTEIEKMWKLKGKKYILKYI